VLIPIRQGCWEIGVKCPADRVTHLNLDGSNTIKSNYKYFEMQSIFKYKYSGSITGFLGYWSKFPADME